MAIFKSHSSLSVPVRGQDLSALIDEVVMKVATKFVSALTPEEMTHLQHLLDTAVAKRVRRRAHSILLSSQGQSIDEIARIYRVHRDTVYAWIDRWTTAGLSGLYDQPRSGGPPKLNEQEQAVAQALIQAHPQAPKTVLGLLAEKTGKTISSSSLRRIAKRSGLRWKRVRKSVKSKRDEQAFRTAQQELETLKKTSR